MYWDDVGIFNISTKHLYCGKCESAQVFRRGYLMSE
jgi:hypothetical protein